MKKVGIILSICAAMAMASCGHGKTDTSSSGDTTSVNDAVNRANGPDGLKDSAGRKAAGDTTSPSNVQKVDSVSKPATPK